MTTVVYVTRLEAPVLVSLDEAAARPGWYRSSGKVMCVKCPAVTHIPIAEGTYVFATSDPGRLYCETHAPGDAPW